MKSPRHPIRPFPNGRQPNILRGAAANALAAQQAPVFPPARTTPQNGSSALLEQLFATPGQRLDTPTLRGEGVHLYLGGDRLRLPAGVALAFGKARGREIAFVVERPGQKVHILVSTEIDGIAELTPISDALAAAVRRIYFSRP